MWATLLVVAVTALVALLLFLVWNRYAKQKAAMQRLYNSQLQEALQIAREANEAKSEFLSRMSHDIRTPMNGIVGMLDISDKNVENPDMVRRCHRKIQIAAEYLLSLINDVLDMSKLEAKNVQLHEESVDLHAGMNAHISKPFDVNKLKQSLAKL